MFEFNRELVSSFNTARTDPSNASKAINSQFKDTFVNTQMHAFGKIIDTFQGIHALDDLTTYLSNQSNINSLRHSKALDQAAQLIAAQKGRQGKIQNQPVIQIYETIKKFAAVDGKVGELVSLCATTPAQIATYFLIDDGLTSRKRRKMLLDPTYKYIGVGQASHTKYETVTVVLLAEVLEEKDSYIFENSRLTEQTKKEGDFQIRERQSASHLQSQGRESQFY